MKKLLTFVSAAAAVLAGATGVVTGSATSAQAVTINGTQVKYVFCSDNQYGNSLTYYNSYGRQQLRNVTLPAHIGGARYCGDIVSGIDSGSYVWSAIENQHSPYVYAAVYSLYTPYHFEGSMAIDDAPLATLLSRDESYNSYGGYNYAVT